MADTNVEKSSWRSTQQGLSSRSDLKRQRGRLLCVGLTTLVVACCILFAGAVPGFAASAQPSAWYNFASVHSIVNYQDKADLEILDNKVKLDPVMMKSIELMGGGSLEAGQSQLGKKLDFIFERVQALLDMRINMGKVSIYVYKDHVQIDFKYKKLRPGAKNIPRSWYVFEQRSVYINLEDITANILAHEIAHHVIDNYYLVRPDAASAEILAVFVEKNFFE